MAEIIVDIFRHAQADNNTKPEFISGRSPEADLTVEGFEQADLLNNRLKREKVTYDQVYTSSLKRVQRTAKRALDGIYPIEEIVEVPELDELSQGDWEGQLRAKIHTLETLNRMNSEGQFFTPANGESLRMVERRFSNWFEDEVLYNPRYSDKNSRVAIFSSGQAIRCFLHYVMGFEARFMFRMTTDNTALTRLRYDQNGWFIDKMNDTAHLYPRKAQTWDNLGDETPLGKLNLRR